MKNLHFAVHTALVFFVAGVLFFSCAVPGNEYGTLVLALPGGGARAAVSSAFTATLKYDIRCAGPGGETRQVRPGGSVSLPLLAGDWTVTVRVLNAADEEIGGKTAAALVERGKVTRLEVPISIDTGRNDITRFTLLTGTEPAPGIIDQEEKAIAVFVPPGTGLANLNFTLVHTGAALSPAPGTSLSFTSPRSFTVTAENGTQKTYTVTVTEEKGWPSDTVWQSYGLGGLQQPGGTIVTSVENRGTELEVKLFTFEAILNPLDKLIADIEKISGGTGNTSAYMLVGQKYTLGYSGYSLSITHYQVVMTLTVTKNGG
jgi:hypothetical protein